MKWTNKNRSTEGTRSSHGYVLVHAPVGYTGKLLGRDLVYEHRVVATQMLGRQLRPGEMVHHINGDKTDNRPENLKVCRSVLEHQAHHRTSGKARRRAPGEDNPVDTCPCGCGRTFSRFDTWGRFRGSASPGCAARLRRTK